MTKATDPAIARELRAIRRQHPDLADTDAPRVMERLAAVRVRFRQLNAIISADGGANAANVELVAETRQLSRAASALEQQLAKPRFDADRPPDAIAEMAAIRRALVAKAKERELAKAITVEPVPAERPFSAAALLRQQRDDRDG